MQSLCTCKGHSAGLFSTAAGFCKCISTAFDGSWYCLDVDIVSSLQ